MSTPVVYNSITYFIPSFGDTGYAQGAGNLSLYLVALATGSLQLTGGVFSLLADANFGVNFGLIAKYFTSVSVNPATAGAIRLANTDLITWRNFPNSGNDFLGVNTADQLTYNGFPVTTQGSTGVVIAPLGTTGAPSYTFVGHQSTGLNSGAGVDLTLAIGGTSILSMNGTGAALTVPLDLGANKITGLANGTAATDAMAFGQNHMFQFVTHLVVTTTSTTSSTFTATALTATITPTSASHQILVQVSGAIENDNIGVNAVATIQRGAVNLATGTNGFMFLRVNSAVNITGQSAVVLDAPATTSPTTYTVYIKNSDNASTVTWGLTGVTQSIVLTEVV